MPKRTVSHVFYSYVVENDEGALVSLSAYRGETVELSKAEAERGDALGAFGAPADDAPEIPDGVELEPLADEVDYSELSPDHLKAEADRRDLRVKGSGANDKVLKKDLVAALEADDS